MVGSSSDVRAPDLLIMFTRYVFAGDSSTVELESEDAKATIDLAEMTQTSSSAKKPARIRCVKSDGAGSYHPQFLNFQTGLAGGGKSGFNHWFSPVKTGWQKI